MSNLVDFLTSKEIMAVYLIAALSIFVCLIIYIVEKNNDRIRRRHNTKELNKLVEKVKEDIEEVEEVEEVCYEQPILEPIYEDSPSLDSMIENSVPTIDNNVSSNTEFIIEPKSISNSIEELEYTSIEPDQATARIELKNLEERLLEEEIRRQQEEIKQQEVVVEDIVNNTVNYENTPIIEEIDNNIKLNSYEEEQEASAIISMEELLSKGKELYEANEVIQYEDEGNEPISLHDLEVKMDKKASVCDNKFAIEDAVSNDIEVLELEDNTVKSEPVNVETIKPETVKVENIKTDHKFKSSPIISPVFGIEGINNSKTNDIELENTANYEKLDQEIKKTNEFLMSLKELQNKLD